MFLQNLNIEALISSVTKDRAFKGIIMIKWGYKNETLIQYPYK